MVRSWDVPKRYIHVSLFDGREGGIKSNKLLSFLSDDAKISFQTQASVGLTASDAVITITGLRRDTMAYLATSYTIWTEESIVNRIVLDAGYDDNHSILFDGEVIEAIPNLDNADFSISLKCQTQYYSLNTEIQSISRKGEVSVKEIAQEIAKKMSDNLQTVSLVYYPEKDYKVIDYEMSNASPFDQMRNLSKQTGLDIYVENGRMYVKEQGKSADGLGSLIIDGSNIIGAPMPDNTGCRVQIRMNCNVKCGMPVKIKSSRFEQLNNLPFFVSEYYHVGETKGKKWFTEVVLIRDKIWG